MKQKIIFVIATILMLSLLNAQQIGEIAGPLNFQVAPGHNQTLKLYIINDGSVPINLQVLNDYSIQYETTEITNQITPIIIPNPQNFTLPAGKEEGINITVLMPSKDALNASWSGIIQVVAVTNASNNGGAVINMGLAKIFSITSVKYIPPKTNATVIKSVYPFQLSSILSNQLGLEIISGFIIIIIIGGIAVYLVGSSRERKKLEESKRKATRKKQKKTSIYAKEAPKIKETGKAKVAKGKGKTTKKNTKSKRTAKRR